MQQLFLYPWVITATAEWLLQHCHLSVFSSIMTWLRAFISQAIRYKGNSQEKGEYQLFPCASRERAPAWQGMEVLAGQLQARQSWWAEPLPARHRRAGWCWSWGRCMEVCVRSRCNWFSRPHLFLIFCYYAQLNISQCFYQPALSCDWELVIPRNFLLLN